MIAIFQFQGLIWGNCYCWRNRAI